MSQPLRSAPTAIPQPKECTRGTGTATRSPGTSPRPVRYPSASCSTLVSPRRATFGRSVLPELKWSTAVASRGSDSCHGAAGSTDRSPVTRHAPRKPGTTCSSGPGSGTGTGTASSCQTARAATTRSRPSRPLSTTMSPERTPARPRRSQRGWKEESASSMRSPLTWTPCVRMRVTRSCRPRGVTEPSPASGPPTSGRWRP